MFCWWPEGCRKLNPRPYTSEQVDNVRLQADLLGRVAKHWERQLAMEEVRQSPAFMYICIFIRMHEPVHGRCWSVYTCIIHVCSYGPRNLFQKKLAGCASVYVVYVDVFIKMQEPVHRRWQVT